MKNIFKIAIAQVVTLVLFLMIVAVSGQIYTFLKPGYENLDVIPDPNIGWRLMPNLEFTYTGYHWYQNEFKTQIKVNSLGFRDKERTVKKQNNVTRMVIMGDSFVTAHEVSFAKTPSQLLEYYLNDGSTERLNGKSRYEVLNFGVTGFGVTQNFLTNRTYIKDFSPEYVFLFLFEENIWRTISISHAITGVMNKNKKLHIRPIFNLSIHQLNNLLKILNFEEFHHFLENVKKDKLKRGKIKLISEEEYTDFIEKQRLLITKEKIIEISKKLMGSTLMLQPAGDFAEFVRLQNETINSKFDGQRTRKREQKIFVLDLWSKLLSGLKGLTRVFQPELKMRDEIEKLLRIYGPRKPRWGPQDLFGGSESFPNFEKVVFTNLKALQMMKDDTKLYGGKLVIVDATSNLIGKGRLPANLLSTILEKFCDVNDIGYIPLYQDLNAANSNGIETRWLHDGHFNELGYQIFAKSMYNWFQKNRLVNGSPG